MAEISHCYNCSCATPRMEDLIVYMSNSTDSELVKDVVAHIQPLRDAIELKVVEVFEGEL